MPPHSVSRSRPLVSSRSRQPFGEGAAHKPLPRNRTAGRYGSNHDRSLDRGPAKNAPIPRPTDHGGRVHGQPPTGVVNNLALEEPVELFGVDAVRSLHFAVEPRRPRFDLDMVDAFVE